MNDALEALGHIYNKLEFILSEVYRNLKDLPICTSFKNINGQQVDVPAVVLTGTFTETRLLTQMDAAAGY